MKEAKETRLLIYAYQFEVYSRMLPVARPALPASDRAQIPTVTMLS